MHVRIEDLIGLRDDEPVAADVATHVAGCDACARELQRLKTLREAMRRMPAFDPPTRLPHLPVMGAVAPRQRPASRRWLPFAAAATATLAVLGVIWSLAGHAPASGPSATVAIAVADPALDSLVTRSQQLEAVLQRMPPRPAVERAATSATIEALQVRIQLVDSQLLDIPQSQPDAQQLQQLWNERVLLMNSLVGMRYAEATRVGYVPNNRRGEW